MTRFSLLTTFLILATSLSPSNGQDDSLVIVTIGGGGHRMMSTDGESFHHHHQWGVCAHDENDLMHATFGNGLFVAGGGWGAPRVVVSADGISWKETPRERFGDAQGAVSRILFIDGEFHLMTQMGFLLRSRDGEQWEFVGKSPLSRKPKMQRVRDMAFGNGVLVGVGDYGAISVSTDMGKTWSVTTAPHHGEDRTWPTVAFGAGVFVIGGAKGYTASSKNGVTWEHESTHDGKYQKIGKLVWTGDEFFAFSNPTKKGPPYRLSSRDGISWTSYQPGWKGHPNAIWKIGETYFGTVDNFFKGNTQLYRSTDAKTWVEIPNEKEYSVRWIVSNAGTN